MFRELLVLTTAGLALGACASAPSANHAGTADHTAATAARDSNCVTSASRLPGPADCRYPGNVYSHDDIERTGQTSPGPALRLLDPAISGH